VQLFPAVTNKRKKKYSTPAGDFSSQYVNNSIFSIGRIIIKEHWGSLIIASRAKAICDKIASVNQKKYKKEVIEYLEK
jgi:hypothetical protein